MMSDEQLEVGRERAPDNNREYLEFVHGKESYVWAISFQANPHEKRKKTSLDDSAAVKAEKKEFNRKVGAKWGGKFAQLPSIPVNWTEHGFRGRPAGSCGSGKFTGGFAGSNAWCSQ